MTDASEPHPIDQLFADGATVYGDYGVRGTCTLGALETRSGGIVICDPSALLAARPLRVAPGCAFAVRLARVRYDHSYEVCALRLDFLASAARAHGTASAWVCRRHRAIVAVDSATACVCSAESAALLRANDLAQRRLSAARKRLARMKRQWCVAKLSDAPLATVFLFNVHDDGAFAIFEARDSRRRLVALAVAFARRALSQAQERRLVADAGG